MVRQQKQVTNNGTPQRVFHDDKRAFLTIAIIVGVALVAFNFDKVTGNVVTEPNSLSVFQDGKKITVQVNYPVGKHGKQNNIIDMKIERGTKSQDEWTKCDADRGFVSRGTSACNREIAEFDIRGQTWNAGEVVVFSVRGTDITRRYVLR
ncbi:MAG: hypothetical protein CMH62_01415 [Nanoarchaeota archaeon]|nr:hypothetical protein [Nanoarchaeota archaeon]